jgi:hypothetical protein
MLSQNTPSLIPFIPVEIYLMPAGEWWKKHSIKHKVLSIFNQGLQSRPPLLHIHIHIISHHHQSSEFKSVHRVTFPRKRQTVYLFIPFFKTKRLRMPNADANGHGHHLLISKKISRPICQLSTSNLLPLCSSSINNSSH